ncbi:MAG TPA: extracellular solute-binding protein [Candidatus Acidoferrum sp.]|jgi:molybdate/tungstate transport system substrate-binding protein|nr:extracellular solute-binding protein [Candidatus Acidoferrum sp.]
MRERVTVLHAGAVTDLIRRGLAPVLLEAEDIELSAVPGHSVALASGILDGSLEGDVYISADARTNALLSTSGGGGLVSWFVVFARNAIVLAYSTSGPLAPLFDRVKRGEMPWHEAVRTPGIKVARNDPNLDPLGYYTVLVCSLAEEHYGLPGLRREVLGDDMNPDQVGRVSLTGLADGSIDAMFLYRSAAIGKPYEMIDLPDAINLSDAALASTYAQVHFVTRDGHDFRGTPISFSATVLASAHDHVAAVRFVDFLVAPAGQAMVEAFHFIPSPILLGGSPGSLPRELAGRVQGTYRGW